VRQCAPFRKTRWRGSNFSVRLSTLEAYARAIGVSLVVVPLFMTIGGGDGRA
jgi:hypothetical protein